MEINLTEKEVKTLNFYLKKSLIDAEGNEAIGIGSKETVLNLKSVMRKINKSK